MCNVLTEFLYIYKYEIMVNLPEKKNNKKVIKKFKFLIYFENEVFRDFSKNPIIV